MQSTYQQYKAERTEKRITQAITAWAFVCTCAVTGSLVFSVVLLIINLITII
jgi:hypothetical protein